MTGADPSQHLRIAVVSDLHVHETPKASSAVPSHISTANSGSKGSLFASLIELVEKQDIKVDVLVCCGDLTNQASVAGLQHGWMLLQQLQMKLGATNIIATVGNHELDSRFSGGVDVKDAIRKITPPYPPLPDAVRDQFWSRHFAIVERDHWRAVILNSAGLHGYSPGGNPEYDFGRVLPETVRDIRDQLKSTPPKPFNFFVCHHHLVSMNTFDEQDYSEMKGADKLIGMLGSGEFGQWLVLHGHKHVPRIDYAYGGNAAPIVFGAGSLAATLAPQVARIVSNQFYTLDLMRNRNANIPIELGGKVRAWDWQPSEGWKEAAWTAHFPHTCGFGWRGIIHQLSVRIVSVLKGKSPHYVTYDELIAAVPEIRFLLPQDMMTLRGDLTSRGVKLLEQGGQLIQLELSTSA